jgi:hypothetical protein
MSIGYSVRDYGALPDARIKYAAPVSSSVHVGGAPPVIGNTLLNDWDPAAVTPFTDLSSVATLPDNTSASPLTQATGTKRPILHTTGLNGFPTVQFDGVSHVLQGTGSNTAACTIFMVATQTGSSSTTRGGLLGMFPSITQDFSGAGIVLSVNLSGDTQWSTVVATGGQLTTNDKVMTVSPIGAFGTFALLCLTVPSGSSIGLFVNGTSTGVTDNNSNTTQMLQINMGARQAASVPTAWAPVSVARALVYSGIVSAGDRAIIDTWVQNTWNITVSDYI